MPCKQNASWGRDGEQGSERRHRFPPSCSEGTSSRSKARVACLCLQQQKASQRHVPRGSLAGPGGGGRWKVWISSLPGRGRRKTLLGQGCVAVCPRIPARPRLAGTLSGQVLQVYLRKTQEKREQGKTAQAVTETAGRACGFLG